MKEIKIISGEVETGKTTKLLKWVERTRSVCGVLSPRQGSMKYLLTFPNRKKIGFETATKKNDSIELGQRYYSTRGFESVNDYLCQKELLKYNEYIVVDEIGQIELSNGGFHRTVEFIMQWAKECNITVVFVVRRKLLPDVISKYMIGDYSVICDCPAEGFEI